MTFRIAILPILVSAALLAACGGNDRLTVDNGASSGSPASSAVVAPPSDLAGRWTLSSPGAGSCAMTLGAVPGATDGTIAPAGGCPFSFFTSRKWAYSEAGLTIRDHNAQTLAQLTPAGPNRFEGKTAAGQEVALSR
jgi:Protease inhibitor Inh